MISLNASYAKLLQNILNAKVEINLIHINKLKIIIETISNNVFIILVIFKNNIINI